MKGKIPSMVMVFVALALVLSLVAVVATNPVSAAPGTLKWTDVTIPNTEDNQLLQDSNPVVIAVSPDGDTIFAGVEMHGGWGGYYLYRSTDDGYTWKEMTGFTGEAGTDELIVDIAISPAWEDDDTLLVATDENVYISGDRGVTFTTMAAPGGTITSIGATLDENDRLALLAGTSTGVYLMKWPLGGWVDQDLLADEWDALYNVLDVAFSPNYATDEQIVCVAYGDDADKGDATAVMTKKGDNNWGVNVADGWFYDLVGNPMGNSTRASIGFPDDYSASPASGKCVIFVGLVDSYVGGDVYRFDGESYLSPESTVTDLNIRGTVGIIPTSTDIWSIAVSGNVTEALIIAGTYYPSNTATPAISLIHWSADSGETWSAADKAPTGARECYVTMGSPIAYAGTSGADSGFSASIDDGATWNTRGLIDTSISDEQGIYDIAVSPAYATDKTVYMVTEDNSVWKSTDGGAKWERVASDTLFYVAGYYTDFESVNLPPTYATTPYVFLAGWWDGDFVIWRSPDAGATFSTMMVPPTEAQDTNIQAWAVAGGDEVWIGGDAAIYWTTDGGDTWDKPTESEIDDYVHSIAVSGNDTVVGAENGKVFISTDSGDTFERLGTEGPGIETYEYMHVTLDANYDANGIVYAAGDEGCGVQRWNPEDEVWEQILQAPSDDPEDIWFYCTYCEVSNICNGGSLVSADDGTLYATGEWWDDDVGDYFTGVWRTVNPTEENVDDIAWEAMDPWVWDDDWVFVLRVAPGSNVLFAIDYYGVADDGSSYLWTYEDTLTGKVSLVSPHDGVTAGTILEDQGTARVVLAWQGMTDADEYEYQVALDEDFGTIVDDASGTTGGAVKDVTLWLGTTFYWRVRATEPLYSQWSETWDFTTPLGPGAARPILESPAAGAQDVALKPVLEWSGLIDATKYELMVARNCSWTDLVVDKTGVNALGNVTTYAIPSGVLAYNTDYCWKVRALSETTTSPWSDIGTFTTITEAAAAEAAPTPAWVWVVIAIGAILVIALIVLIVRTRRPV